MNKLANVMPVSRRVKKTEQEVWDYNINKELLLHSKVVLTGKGREITFTISNSDKVGYVRLQGHCKVKGSMACYDDLVQTGTNYASKVADFLRSLENMYTVTLPKGFAQ